MKLTERLLRIADMVPKGGIVADIGTDHGFLPVYLIQKEICIKAYAIDISNDSLLKAQILIKEKNLQGKIITRQGKGLTVIKPGEVDVVILSGMGGLLICKILKDSPEIVETIKVFLFQPMIAQNQLRKWLYENNFTIIDEELVREENRYYTIMKAVPISEQRVLWPYSNDLYFDIGWKLIQKKHSLFPQYLKKKTDDIKKMIKHLQNENTVKSKKRLNELSKKLLQYEEVYGWNVDATKL